MGRNEICKVLLTWELGEDLGHLARLRPLAARLQRRGHHVVLAASKLGNVATLPGSLAVIPAPGPEPGRVKDAIREPATFADILYNAGVTRDGMLAGTVRAWRGIFDLVKPDVVVQDFSPHTLLARTGFACPPNTRSLPDIRGWQNHYPERMAMTEQQVLDALNRQLASQGQPALAGIGELFTRADANCLATFRELDHYPMRLDNEAAPDYVGVWSDLGGDPPRWPEGEGPRVFAYLKSFRALPRLLDHMSQTGFPCLVYLRTDFDAERWRSRTLSIVRKPLDMARVSRECDLAVLHAGHGSTATHLLAGNPILQLPFNVEQFHTAKNTEHLGAGAMAMIDDPTGVVRAFDRVAVDEDMRKAAAVFAERHRDFDPAIALETVVDRIEALAAR
jgi:UDP:flavonoid glycosyltransferase YjiC (YdhE family)